MPSRETIIWKEANGLVWHELALLNTYCLTPFSPNHMIIIALSFQISSKALQTLQRSHLQVWDRQTYFSPFLNPDCWIFTFPADMESQLWTELKKITLAISLCFHMPVLPGRESIQAPALTALSSLSGLFPALRLLLSPRTILLSLSITRVQSPFGFWLNL